MQVVMNEDKYNKFKRLLNQNASWPMLYMFKFIVPNLGNKVEKVASLLPPDGEISYKHTENLKFVSVTCKVVMPSAESIAKITEEIGSIDGVICL